MGAIGNYVEYGDLKYPERGYFFFSQYKWKKEDNLVLIIEQSFTEGASLNIITR